jgi:peptidoglycan/LPS O-acetylase OafA/YrhL
VIPSGDDVPRQSRPPHKPTGASLIVLICLGVTVVGILVLHLVRRDLDPLQDVMSHYANGPNGPLMSVVFYAFGVSAIAMGVRLRSGLDRRGVTRPVPWLLVLAGSSLLVAGVFEVDRPTDPETTGEVIHSNTAVTAFLLLVGAMVLFAIACRRDQRWWSMRWTSLGLAVVAGSAAVATQVTRSAGTAGGVQRLLAGAVLVWLVLVAVHVRRASFDAP